jgi:hypothetical protein
MLVAAAIASLLMGSGRLLWLSSVYRKLAVAHAALENLSRTLQSMAENDGKAERELLVAFDIEVEPEDEVVKAQRAAYAGLNQRTAEYHANLKRKYEKAAAHPWMPIDPVPPLPKPDGIVYPPESE